MTCSWSNVNDDLAGSVKAFPNQITAQEKPLEVIEVSALSLRKMKALLKITDYRIIHLTSSLDFDLQIHLK
jgi:hypothetical protein